MLTEGQVSLFDLDSPCGKTYPEPIPATAGKTSKPSSRRFVTSGGGHDHIVPMPAGGRWKPAGCIVGNGWSVAWRTLDAQFWGVPQRRKRIFLVADFAGERAGEVLFNEDRLHGDSSEGEETREGTAAHAERSAGRSGGVRCLNQWDCESKRQYAIDGVYRTLDAGNGAGGQAHGVCYPSAFMGGQGAKAGSIAYCDDGSTPTLKSVPSGGNTIPDVVYPINTMVGTRGGKDDMRTCFGIGEPNDPEFTISAAHSHGVAYCIDGNVIDRDAKQNGIGISEDVSPTLNTQDKNAVCYKQDGFAGYKEGVGTLKASGGDVGGGTESIVLERI